MIKRGPLRGRTNVTLLFLTYGLGQGGLLIAQTSLVVHSQLAFVGLFGLSFTMATLAYYVVDWGGQTLLAREELAHHDAGRSSGLYWNLSMVRLFPAFVVTVISCLYAGSDASEFTAGYALTAMPAFLLGAFNPAGLLDGLRRSGANGISSMLPMAASAVALVSAAGLPAQQQGYLLGAAFSAGIAAGTAFQFLTLKWADRIPAYETPTWGGMARAAREGGLVGLLPLPPLIFYRFEIAVSMAALGPVPTGLFVYSRQIVSAALQGAQLIRRAEFPMLMAATKTDLRLRSLFLAQRFSLSFGMATVLGLSLGGLSIYTVAPAQIGAAALVTASFAPAVLASALFSAMIQVYIGLGRVMTGAAVMNSAVAAAMAVTVPAVWWLGIFGFAIVEFGMNIVPFLCLLMLLSGGLPQRPIASGDQAEAGGDSSSAIMNAEPPTATELG